MRIGLYTAMAGSLLMATGCFLGNDKESKKKGGGVPKMASCVELSPDAKSEADALVKQANEYMVSDMQYLFDGSAQSWGDVKARNSQAALGLYDKALDAAPGHCGALFGRAVVSAMRITQEPKLDEFVQKVENSSGSSAATAKIGSGRALLKVSPSEAAPVLIKLSADLENTDRVTLSEAQALIESTLMPKLDSTIASLDQVLEFEAFTFEFVADGRVYQLDRGDIGPLLAGLKVIKAWMTMAVAYKGDFSKDGSYAWMRTLGDMYEDDVDSLSLEQKEALDHYTGLFQPGSSFSRIRPEWKTRLSEIPALLLSAVENAQAGLKYGIAEAGKPTGQENDLYVVGPGTNADVDPKDLEEAVELLERSKKYLKGEVPISYNKGSQTLKVNFPRLFHIDGIQNLFPYFKWKPYAEWNDVVGADTNWNTLYVGATKDEILHRLGYKSRDWNLWVSEPDESGEIQLRDGFGGWNPGDSDGSINTLAILTPKEGSPCRYTYVKKFSRVEENQGTDFWGYDGEFKSVPQESQGEITLRRCRVSNGITEFILSFSGNNAIPFYFTDAQGNATLKSEDFDAFQGDLSTLKGKVVFRDPTFGGLFPGLTQDNIWSTIKSLETVKPRTREVCTETMEGDWNYRRECRLEKAVVNPSDLDLLISNLYWVGKLINPDVVTSDF